MISAYPPEEMERITGELSFGGSSSEIPLRTESGKAYGIIGRAVSEAANNRQPLIVNNVQGDPDYVEVHKETKSQLTVLLPPLEPPLGIISIESPDLNTFYEEDEGTFELFAALAADAIRNAQQYTDLSAARHREEAATDFAFAEIWGGIFAHDYMNEAAGMIRAAKFLQEGIKPGAKANELAESADILVERAEKLGELNPAQTMKYESFPIIILGTHLSHWAHDRITELQRENIKLVFTSRSHLDVNVRIQPRLLSRVLELFLNNAKAAMSGVPNGKLTLEATAADDHVEITLSNTGPAIPDSTWQALGVTPVASTTEGKGLGVMMAFHIIRHCKGEFLKLRNVDGDVAVGMRLPVAEETA
jgi:signal transduction histidine kinase